jgi:transcriptional regulator with GAF, ATPase, and Fis domain
MQQTDTNVTYDASIAEVMEQIAEAAATEDLARVSEVLESAVALSRTGRLRLGALPTNGNGHGNGHSNGNGNGHIMTEAERREQERNNIIHALRMANGRIYGDGGAAKLLGLKPSTLSSRMKAFKIRAREEH